jgi:hypothetical protein
MIFPIPYTKGSKDFPIIGVANTYPIDEVAFVTEIGTALGTGKATTVNTPSTNKFLCDWFDRWFSINDPQFLKGIQYILLPKQSPIFPRYYYWADKENGTWASIIEVGQSLPAIHGIPVFKIYDDFEYNSKKYILYCMAFQTDSNNIVGTPMFLANLYLGTTNSIPLT